MQANWELQAGCWSISRETVGLSLEEAVCCLGEHSMGKARCEQKTSTHSPLPIWWQVPSGTTSLVEDEDSNPGSAFTWVCNLPLS